MCIFLEKIINDKRYLKLCKKLTKGSYLADDLYQEFILIAIEKNVGAKFETYEETNKYCMGIISNIQRKAHLKSSPLFNITNQSNEIQEFTDEQEIQSEVTLTIENNLDTALMLVSKSVKNFQTFCQDAGINYSNSIYRIHKQKTKLRNGKN